MKITSDNISDIFLNKFCLAFKKNYCKTDQFHTVFFTKQYKHVFINYYKTHVFYKLL